MAKKGPNGEKITSCQGCDEDTGHGCPWRYGTNIPADCLLDDWTEPDPPKIWACGFCGQKFDVTKRYQSLKDEMSNPSAEVFVPLDLYLEAVEERDKVREERQYWHDVAYKHGGKLNDREAELAGSSRALAEALEDRDGWKDRAVKAEAERDRLREELAKVTADEDHYRNLALEKCDTVKLFAKRAEDLELELAGLKEAVEKYKSSHRRQDAPDDHHKGLFAALNKANQTDAERRNCIPQTPADDVKGELPKAVVVGYPGPMGPSFPFAVSGAVLGYTEDQAERAARLINWARGLPYDRSIIYASTIKAIMHGWPHQPPRVRGDKPVG